MKIRKHVTRFINCKIPGGGAQIVRRKTQNPIKTMNEAHQLPFSTLQLAASHTCTLRENSADAFHHNPSANKTQAGVPHMNATASAADTS
jgi:hypothetical protein